MPEIKPENAPEEEKKISRKSSYVFFFIIGLLLGALVMGGAQNLGQVFSSSASQTIVCVQGIGHPECWCSPGGIEGCNNACTDYNNANSGESFNDCKNKCRAEFSSSSPYQSRCINMCIDASNEGACRE